MKSPLISLLMALALLTAVPAQAQKAAPDFTLQGDKGSVVLSAHQGEVIYLDFWASWCAPCRESFPWMNSLQKKYGKRGLKIIAVNLDKERNNTRAFIEATTPGFTIAYDPEGSIAEHYGVMGMPSSYLIDRNGKVHSSHIGFRAKDKAELEKKIVQLLESN
jgi:cytochrome c biogenesis protein CcmG/thiol:disulfide interchange protein DsbE